MKGPSAQITTENERKLFPQTSKTLSSFTYDQMHLMGLNNLPKQSNWVSFAFVCLLVQCDLGIGAFVYKWTFVCVSHKPWEVVLSERSLNFRILFLGKRVRDPVLQVLVTVLGNPELHTKLALEILPSLDLRQL